MTINILTAILVLVTAFYAWATFKILRANENVVAAMNQQTDLLIRPYINIRAATAIGSAALRLIIENTGKTSAINLQLQMDRDFYQYGERDKKRNLARLNAFQLPIESFPPSAELIFYLAQGFKILGEDSDPQVTPPVFNIKATYSYLGHQVVESTTIDLRQFLGASLEQSEHR